MRKGKTKLIQPSDATGVGVLGSSHFTMLVQCDKLTYIAGNVELYVVMKNHGPAMINYTAHNGLEFKLVPGGLWVMTVVGDLFIASLNGAPALLEIEFLPYRRNWR